MDFILALEFWHWLALGIIILILEILGVGGFLLGMGVAALTVGGLLYIFSSMLWYWQWLLFALLSIVFSLIYWKKFRRFNHRTEQPQLNARTALLIGRKVPLLTAVRNGLGKVQIGDALWTVRYTGDLEQGDIVEVVAIDDMALSVKPVQEPAGQE